MSRTTFSGTVYGSIQHPSLKDSVIKVLGCDDGSVAIAWGTALDHASEGDRIHFAGCGDGDNGYHVVIDPPDLGMVGDYVVQAFFATLSDDEWRFESNGDVYAGLTYVGHIGDDGTISVSADLAECGVSWEKIQAAMPEQPSSQA